MARELLIIGALANFEHGPNKNSLLQEINNEVDGFYLYKQVFEPGVVYASLNWQGVIGTAASISSIAALAWSIYITKIQPQENNPNNELEPKVVIQIKNSDGEFEIFSIDGKYESKEVFIEEFTHKVEVLRAGEDGSSIKETIEKSGRWVHVK